jgi:hypothetical protein
MIVDSHYAGAKEKDRKDVRYMTREEARQLRDGSHVLVLSQHGRWANARVNGEPKTWKRDPLHVRVSLKYGMYEYWQVEFTSDRPETDLVVEVKEAA